MRPDPSSHGASRRIARNAAVRATGEVIAKVASLAFFVVMARELGPSGFGDFMFALSLATVFILAAGFGTEELVAREVARDRERVHTYLANVVAVKAIASVLLVLALGAIANLGSYSSDARAAIYLVGLGVAIENLGRTWHSIFTAFERLEMISISLVIQRTLTAAVGVVVLLSGGGVIAVSIVFLGGAVVGLLVATEVLRRFVVAPRWHLDRSRWMPLLRAGVPIGLATLIFTILLKVDAALLGFLAGGEDNREVGVYGAAFRVIEATLFISWAFSASILPWLSLRKEAGEVARGYEFGLKAITGVLTPIALTFVLLASEIVDLLYGAGYEDAVLPLQMLGVLTLLYGVNTLASTVLVSRDRPQDFTRIVAVVAVENIVVNLLTIPRYGADAAAFNAALSGVLLAILSVVVVSRRLGAIRLVRAFGSPVAGGAAMTAAVLPASLPLVPAAALGLAVYTVAALAFERLAFPDDFRRFRALIPALDG